MQKIQTVALVLGFGCWAMIASASPPSADAQGDLFGTELTLSEPTALADIVASPERFDGKPVLLIGHVADVCQRKGCWTVLQDGDATIRVRFEDYGFFLPKDASGRRALIQGLVSIKTLSEAEARHYAEESKTGDPAKIHGPQHELGFMASGVRLGDRSH